MGLMGSLVSSDMSDVLKGVLKATPAGAAAQAMASLVKDTGMMDQMSKLLDGAVKKPKPGGIGGIGGNGNTSRGGNGGDGGSTGGAGGAGGSGTPAGDAGDPG